MFVRSLFLLCFCFVAFLAADAQSKIDRKAVVQRHDVVVNRFDTMASLTVGNGLFAFTVDATGLQSFPNEYARGVPLGTQSEWGWHSFPNTGNYTEEETLEEYDLNGRKRAYAVQIKTPERKKKATEYYRQNLHRLQLGNIGLEIIRKDGSVAGMKDVAGIVQKLVLWTGEIHSAFNIDGTPVEVITYCHQQQDAIAVKIKSPLIKEGRLQIRLRFPYPTGAWSDAGVNWANEERHLSRIVSKEANRALVQHQLDTTSYTVGIQWKGAATIAEKSKHYFIIKPAEENFEAVFRFDGRNSKAPIPSFAATQTSSERAWEAFWKSGGAVDFGGSTDPRAHELERRMILSQYLLKAQEAGDNPPQETGLTYNSWYGKPHIEMHYWHSMHYALWGRIDLLERILSFLQIFVFNIWRK